MIVGIAATLLLLAFLIGFPRHLKPVVSLIGIVWLVMGVSLIFDWQRGNARRASVIGSAMIDPSCTDPRAPLRLTFDNQSDATALRLTYRVEGFQPAFRVPVASDTYQISQVPIGPGESYSACRSFRMGSGETGDPAMLEWRVTIDSAEFR